MIAFATRYFAVYGFETVSSQVASAKSMLALSQDLYISLCLHSGSFRLLIIALSVLSVLDPSLWSAVGDCDSPLLLPLEGAMPEQGNRPHPELRGFREGGRFQICSVANPTVLIIDGPLHAFSKQNAAVASR